MEVSQRAPFLREEKSQIDAVVNQPSSRPRKDRSPICYRVLFYITSAVALSILSSLIYRVLDLYVFPNPRLDVNQLEVKKCPGCAGQSACPAFFRGDIHLSRMYRNSLTYHLIHQPPTGLEATMGLYELEKPVYLRRLGSPSPPNVVDDAVCRRGLPQGYEDALPPARDRLRCIPHLAIWRWRPTNVEPRSPTSQKASQDSVDLPLARHMVVAPVFHSARTNATAQSDSSEERVWAQSVMPTAFAPATRCASDRMFALLQARFRERTSFAAETRWTRFDELMFLFNLAIDPQPIISQAFPRTELWPFPVHLGACGRWVVQARHGIPLNRFCVSPLWLRLRIIQNMLSLPERLERPPNSNPGSFGYSHRLDPSSDLTEGYTIYLGAFDLGNTYVVDPSTYEVTVADLRQAIIVDTQTLMDLGFTEENITEFTVPKAANKHLIRGLIDHRCLGDVKSQGDAGGSTPACVLREHADKLCEHTRSDHNVWAICATLLYSTSSETNTGDTLCSNFLSDLPGSVLQLLNRCVNLPQIRRVAFGELRELVNQLIDSTPFPRGL